MPNAIQQRLRIAMGVGKTGVQKVWGWGTRSVKPLRGGADAPKRALQPTKACVRCAAVQTAKTCVLDAIKRQNVTPSATHGKRQNGKSRHARRRQKSCRPENVQNHVPKMPNAAT